MLLRCYVTSYSLVNGFNGFHFHFYLCIMGILADDAFSMTALIGMVTFTLELLTSE